MATAPGWASTSPRRTAKTHGLMLAAVTAVALLGPVAPSGPAAAAPAPAAPAPGPATPADGSVQDPIAHDPTMIKEGRYYYTIITGDIGTRTYLPIRRSTDLVNWEFLGTVFTTPPAWVVQELGVTPGDFWAPDITFFDGEYHLYYAASSFGTNNSVIGLATNTTLDPNSPDYRWVDRGMVLRSSTADDFNAIDPEVTFDRDGAAWLSFGSFWTGIKMRRLDPGTGFLSSADTTLYPLASRAGIGVGAVEGPAILYRRGYYYLFVSFDFCCRGVNSDYRVMVGRSRSITGPYLDRAGVDMMAGGGTELLRGYNEFRGPGGGDVYSERGVDWFTHHYYDAEDEGTPRLSVRRISWDDGWPGLGDPLTGSSRVGHGGAYFTVVNRATGGVLDNASCGYEGADIVLSTRRESACAQWRLDDWGNDTRSLLNRYSNKVAEVAACVDAEGARVAQWGWLDNDCQQFRFSPTEAGWSRIENVRTGRVLQPAECAGAGAAVQVFTWTSATCQQFRVEPVGQILIADATGQRVLDIAGCGRGDGRTAVVSRPRDSACQRWRFVHLEEGYFAVVNARSGRPLTTLDDRRLALGRPGRAAQWRIEVLSDGSYRLVNRVGGGVVQLGGGQAIEAAADDSAGQRVLLLTP
ncbi:MAG TPA: family 43 glycosylhydrolase [Micromonosporaceae bacterium]|nr:family 43 glycosylhydrolase [Micromonosporaceae bacterium]